MIVAVKSGYLKEVKIVKQF